MVNEVHVGQVRYTYIRGRKPRQEGVNHQLGTTAFLIRRDPGSADYLVSVGAAFWNDEEDVYEPAIGRDLAYQRLRDDPVIFTAPGSSTLTQICRMVLVTSTTPHPKGAVVPSWVGSSVRCNGAVRRMIQRQEARREDAKVL